MSLKLVSSFTIESYPEGVRGRFEQPRDVEQRTNLTQHYKRAITMARIDDYKLLETFHTLEVLFGMNMTCRNL